MTAVRECGGTAKIGNATSHWSTRRGLIVEVREGGARGFGEASPLPGFSRESFEDVRRELTDLASRNLDAEELAQVPLSSSARFAVDTAILDSQARQRQCSIAELLCGREAPAARSSLLLGDPRDGNRLDHRFRCTKLKVGPGSAWDAQAAAISALVASADNGHRLRLDFNGSLSVGEANRILSAIADWDWPVDYVEDPVPSERLAEVKSKIDIGVDALLCTPGGAEQARKLALEGSAQVAVLKPALLGGLLTTYRLATDLADLLDPVISHLLDGPIAIAACAELACAVAAGTAEPQRAAGVGPHRALEAFALEPMPGLESGWLRPQRGGLASIAP